jgi:hypothetical protein
MLWSRTTRRRQRTLASAAADAAADRVLLDEALAPYEDVHRTPRSNGVDRVRPLRAR